MTKKICTVTDLEERGPHGITRPAFRDSFTWILSWSRTLGWGAVRHEDKEE